MNKAYQKYKPSGVEWLGDVPEHWECYRISDLARYGKKTFTDGDWIESPYITDDGVRLLQTGNVGIGKFKEQGYRYVSEETFKELGCTEIDPGDVLICRLADPVGRACVAPKLNEKMITSVDVAILKLRSMHLNSYIVYALSSDQYLNFLAMLCRGGTRDRVSRSMLGQIRISLPPLPEQQAIAAFLDRETGRIDALIAKKQQLLELLAEQRTALISRAVTKGLDASAKLKPSGVEWLGDVPEHWEVKRLKYQVTINDETLLETTDPDYEMLYVDISSVDPAQGIIQKEEHIFENAPSRARRIVRDGDTIVSTVRTYLRAIAPVIEPEENLIVSTGFAVIRPRKIDKDYLSATIRAPYFIEEVVSRSVGVSYPAINASEIGFIAIPIPPLPEQQAIAAFLDCETAKIDKLSAKVTTVIERLKEYRTALISSAVTGKIDVREAV